MAASNAPQRTLVDFFRSTTRLAFKKGEVIIRPEDEPSGIFYIESGFVKVYSITKYGEENLLIVRGEGSVFPLIWVFTNLLHEVTYEAMESTVLWRCGREKYLQFLDTHPEVLPIILDMAIEGYRLHSDRVNTLSYRTVRERVVSFLLTCADRFGKRTEQGLVIDAPLRRHDIANSVNATRETTSRELAALTRRGLVSEDRDHNIVIKDVAKLRDML